MYWKGNLQVSVWFIPVHNEQYFSNYEIVSITLEFSSHFTKMFEIGLKRQRAEILRSETESLEILRMYLL